MPFTPEEIGQIIEQFIATVGTRQYIGARYVPIFGRRGEQSIEWDNSAPYEPLTIVLYQGNSYTSRQYVPAGIEITNAEFWASTGLYNAQIESYRQEVQGFSSQIGALETALPIADFEESTVAAAIAESDTKAQQAIDAATTLSSTLSEIMPTSAFDATRTIQAALTNDVAAQPNGNPYVYVACATGDDANEGTIDAPFRTIRGALDWYRRNNGRDLRIYLIESGVYDASDIIRLTNCQLHIITQNEVAATLRFGSIYMYNCYLHFEGGSTNYLTVESGPYFHLDFGLTYFYRCNVILDSLALQSNLIVTNSKIHVNAGGGNCTCNNGYVFLTNTEIEYESEAKSRYLRLLNCQTRITGRFTLTQLGGTARTQALLYLDDGVFVLHTTDIHTNSAATNAIGVYLNNALAMSINTAYNALAAIATEPYAGYGIVKRTAGLTYVD